MLEIFLYTIGVIIAIALTVLIVTLITLSVVAMWTLIKALWLFSKEMSE